MVKVAFFTSQKNMGLINRVLCKYVNDIEVIFVLEDKECANNDKSVYRFINERDKNYSFIHEMKFEIAVVYGWSHKIPEMVLSKLRFFNIHPSLLPQYRGPDPITFQLLNNELKSGITIHKMEKEFDTGSICIQESFDIKSSNIMAFHVGLSKCFSHALDIFISKFLDNNLNFYVQDDTYYSYFSYKDIDMYNTINARLTYIEFLRIFDVLHNKYPVYVLLNNEKLEIKSFSTDITKNSKEYNLADKKVYLSTF